MAVFYHFFKSDLARFKKRAFSAAYCLENRWYGRFEIFCSSQTWNWVFIKYVSPEMIIISHFSNVFSSTFFHVLKGFFENFHVFSCAFWEELRKRMCVLSGILTRTRQHWRYWNTDKHTFKPILLSFLLTVLKVLITVIFRELSHVKSIIIQAMWTFIDCS